MKKQLLLPLLFAAVLGTASAQNVIVRTYVEKTNMSPKTGTSIGFENRYQWEYGAFFQEASLMESFMMSEEDLEALPHQYEKDFAGLYFAVPVISRELFVVKANVRTGMSNGENFVITPSVLADYKPIKHVRIGMGVGSRAFRPTLQASVALSF
ncbi:MAG: hypothetical protein RLN88_12845 [Ekhidna sp.]|uniref:hypothetical protein n=1 Tax=Ekhidna sp. TaxID=2608089 RepID=UPI0032EF10B7